MFVIFTYIYFIFQIVDDFISDIIVVYKINLTVLFNKSTATVVKALLNFLECL